MKTRNPCSWNNSTPCGRGKWRGSLSEKQIVAPYPVHLEPTLEATGIARLFWQRPRTLVTTCCLVLFSFAVSGAVAQEWILSPDQHAWGHCKPGSWKTVRVISDMLDKEGKVTSTTKTETTTTLVGKKGNNYTLEVEVTVEIGDRRITSEPKEITRSFTVNGDGKINLKRQGKVEELDFNGTSIPLDKLEVTLRGEIGRRQSVVLASKEVAPFIFRRTTMLFDNENIQQYRTLVSVEEHGLAHKVLGETKTVCHLKTVHTQNKKVTTTDETYCADVPGGIIAHRSFETNEAGKVTRRSTLELIDYGTKDNSGRRKGKRTDNPAEKDPAPEPQ